MSHILITKQGRITTISLNRPESRNAVNPQTAEQLYAAMIEFDNDPEADVAVLTGEGGAFCAGWDLKEGAANGAGIELKELNYPTDLSEPPRAGIGCTRLEMSKPVIAAIAGPAVAGGMELALWADIRIMEKGAYMGVYCRRWGVPLIDGGTVRLPRMVGRGRALELILTGRKIEADECLALGLCERVVDTGHARTAAENLAAEITGFPQGCLRADRRSVYQQQGLPEREAMMREWYNGIAVVEAEALAGAQRFANGEGRHGKFQG